MARNYGNCGSTMFEGHQVGDCCCKQSFLHMCNSSIYNIFIREMFWMYSVARCCPLNIQERCLYVQERLQKMYLLLCCSVTGRQTMSQISAILAFLLFLWALQEPIFWSKGNGLRRQIPWCYLCSCSAGELCYNGVPVCSVSSESITSKLSNFFSKQASGIQWREYKARVVLCNLPFIVLVWRPGTNSQ